MWLYFGILLFSLYLIPSLLQLLKKTCFKNDTKSKAENEQIAGRQFKRLGLSDLLVLISKGVTVEWGMPNYEWVYNLSKQVGPICYITAPSRYLLSICGHLDLCKKIMGSSSLWPDRLYDNHYMHTSTFNKPLGLLFGTGEHYKRAHRLTLKLLHQFEFFKPSRMESFITYEISEIESNLEKNIAKQGGEYTFCTHGMFQIATLNNIWQLIAGRRFAYDDPSVHEMLDSWNKANREQSIGFTMLEIIPFLKYFPRLSFLQSTQHMSNITYDHFRKIIKEMREERERSNYQNMEPASLLEGFLWEVDKAENKNDEYVTEENMLAVMRDMVIAGGDTVNNAMEFAVYYMAMEPGIQAKVREEIDLVIGSSGRPSYTDKDRMPYTQAVLQEILRIACPVPGTGRSAASDIEIDGLKLTKGSFVGINIYSLHRDETVWEDPFRFQPERFMDANGKLVNFEKTLAFGYGKRSCTGESVARVSLFIFFVSLMQRFIFEMSETHGPPTHENMVGLTRSPQPHFVTVRQRGQLARP